MDLENESDDLVQNNQHAYTNMISAINDTAEKVLPKRKKSCLTAQIASNPEYIHGCCQGTRCCVETKSHKEDPSRD